MTCNYHRFVVKFALVVEVSALIMSSGLQGGAARSGYCRIRCVERRSEYKMN